MKKDTTISQNYNGFFRGIVIDNADPDSRGRVKVFLPEFATSIITAVGLPDDIDYEVKFVGTSPLLSGEALEYAKRVCKWAEQASPLVGSGSAGILAGGVNPTVSDARAPGNISPQAISIAAKGANGAKRASGRTGASNIGESTLSVFPEPDLLDPNPSNESINFATLSANSFVGKLINGTRTTLDETGVNSGAAKEINKVKSDFPGQTSSTSTNVASVVSNSASPSTYPNTTKGLFSIPNIGANVWVFFENNNPNCPVYFAYMYDQNDWGNIQSITKTDNGIDYPRDGKDNIHRGKLVLNSTGGTIEIIDTSGFERIKMSSYGGSSIELNNLSNIEIASGNKDTIVMGSSFTTINGTRNISTKKNSDENITGDRYLKIGKQDPETIDKYNEWAKIDSQLASINALPILSPTVNLPNPSIKTKEFKLFPTTEEAIEALPKESSKAASGVAKFFQLEVPNISVSVPVGLKFEPALSPSSQDAASVPSPTQSSLPNISKLLASQLATIEEELGEGGNNIIQLAKHKTEIIGAIHNKRDSVRIIEDGRAEVHRLKIDKYASYSNYTAFQHVSPVGQYPFPCGTASTTASKYSLLVGSGGVGIKTIGVLNLSSKITTLVGEHELNLSSKHSVNIRGKCIVIGSAEDSNDNALVLRNADQVVVDCNLGVKRNIIVGGGVTIEGNLCVRSISAPVELQQTEPIILSGETVQGTIIGWVEILNVKYPVYGGSMDGVPFNDSIKIYSHYHNFKNLPLTLHSSIFDIPDTNAFNSSTAIAEANPVKHGNKVITPTTLA